MAATTTTTRYKMAAIAALLFALACCGASAQSLAPESASAPSPTGSSCFTVLVNMSDCLTYVEDGSNLTKPDKGCCPELAGLVDSNPICLCELLGNPDSIGIKINLNKALKLPSVCGVTTPPVSTCSAVGVPVSLPSGPSPSSEDSASPSPNPSSHEAAASPSKDKNDGPTVVKASAVTFIFGLATISVSIFF